MFVSQRRGLTVQDEAHGSRARQSERAVLLHYARQLEHRFVGVGHEAAGCELRHVIRQPAALHFHQGPFAPHRHFAQRIVFWRKHECPRVRTASLADERLIDKVLHDEAVPFGALPEAEHAQAVRQRRIDISRVGGLQHHGSGFYCLLLHISYFSCQSLCGERPCAQPTHQ